MWIVEGMQMIPDSLCLRGENGQRLLRQSHWALIFIGTIEIEAHVSKALLTCIPRSQALSFKDKKKLNRLIVEEYFLFLAF